MACPGLLSPVSFLPNRARGRDSGAQDSGGGGSPGKPSGWRWWDRLGKGRRSFSKGLAWLDWEAREVNHHTVKLSCLRQGPGFCPPMGMSLERGTGRRRGWCPPSSLSGCSGLWLPMAGSGVSALGTEQQLGMGRPSGKGLWAGPSSMLSSICFTTLDPLLFSSHVPERSDLSPLKKELTIPASSLVPAE